MKVRTWMTEVKRRGAKWGTQIKDNTLLLLKAIRGLYYLSLNKLGYWKQYVANKFFPKDNPIDTLQFTLTYKGKSVPVNLLVRNARTNPNYIPLAKDFNLDHLIDTIDFQIQLTEGIKSLVSEKHIILERVTIVLNYQRL